VPENTPAFLRGITDTFLTKTFAESIIELQKKHPENSKDDDGTPFWSGKRRYPEPTHQFPDYLKQITYALFLEAWEKKGIEFEKDDDTNDHVAWMMNIANLRARCYKIPENKNFNACRVILGRIVPAIVSTTAAVSALVFHEAVKILQHPIRAFQKNTVMTLNCDGTICESPPHVNPEENIYRNHFLNLGLNMHFSVETMAPITYTDTEWSELEGGPVQILPSTSLTCWDDFVISSELIRSESIDTLGDFKNYMESKFDMDILRIETPFGDVYSDLYDAITQETSLNRPLNEFTEYGKLRLSIDAEIDDTVILFPLILA
jgi:hypothetical protein